MIKTKVSIIILMGSLLAGVLFSAGCSSFVPEEDSERITLKYQAGEYVLLDDINRNNIVFSKGSIVKLLVVTGDDWVKIYAYNSNEELLSSKRFLLLYLFEDDFPDEKFNQEFLDAELLKAVRPKGSAEQSPKESKGSTKKVKK
jgi:type II secretion system-associated lipoprotein